MAVETGWLVRGGGPRRRSAGLWLHNVQLDMFIGSKVSILSHKFEDVQEREPGQVRPKTRRTAIQKLFMEVIFCSEEVSQSDPVVNMRETHASVTLEGTLSFRSELS